MIKKNEIQILETTLRDGSYVIDFQFTARDTEVLSQALERLGIGIIEIGHGVGINASASKGRAAATDVEYIKAARKGTREAKIGMFCIPGIATLDHLKSCVDAGLQFVRIGVNVDQVTDSEKFIQEAKKMGLFVCTNFMKSYALPPIAFAEVVKISADYGSDLVYLVDSAGGMLPNEVKEYFEAMQKVTKLPLGFHGHNNLNLAVANSLAAIESGATLIDTTLLGMGRSSGNAPTEIMVPLLQRCFNSCKNIDSTLMLELGEEVISPMIKNRWESSDKTALGMSQVHSMYAEKIRSASRSSKKLFFSVISEVGKLDKINLSEKTLSQAVSAALPVNNLKRVLGDLTLIESLNDESSVDEVVRVAIKLNFPINIHVRASHYQRKVSLEHSSIEMVCQPKEAAEVLKRGGRDLKNNVEIDQDLLGSDQALQKVLDVLAESGDVIS